LKLVAEKLKILIINGSVHVDSLNLKIAKIVEKELQSLETQSTLIHLGEEKLPPFEGYGVPYPPRVNEILKLMTQADGFIFVVPEYHRSMPSVFKNLFEYIDDEEVKIEDRPAALVTATEGQWGQFAQMSMHGMLRTLRVWLVPDQMYISQASTLLDEQGNLKDEKLLERLKSLVSRLVRASELLRPLRNGNG